MDLQRSSNLQTTSQKSSSFHHLLMKPIQKENEDFSSSSSSEKLQRVKNTKQIKKRQRRSDVWKFFDFDDQKKSSTCKFCPFSLMLDTTKGTTMMRRHIFKCHAFNDEIKNNFKPKKRQQNKKPKQKWNSFTSQLRDRNEDEQEFLGLLDSQYLENQINTENNDILGLWNYIEQKNGNVVTCKLCFENIRLRKGFEQFRSHLHLFHGVNSNGNKKEISHYDHIRESQAYLSQLDDPLYRQAENYQGQFGVFSNQQKYPFLYEQNPHEYIGKEEEIEEVISSGEEDSSLKDQPEIQTELDSFDPSKISRFSLGRMKNESREGMQLLINDGSVGQIIGPLSVFYVKKSLNASIMMFYQDKFLKPVCFSLVTIKNQQQISKFPLFQKWLPKISEKCQKKNYPFGNFLIYGPLWLKNNFIQSQSQLPSQSINTHFNSFIFTQCMLQNLNHYEIQQMLVKNIFENLIYLNSHQQKVVFLKQLNFSLSLHYVCEIKKKISAYLTKDMKDTFKIFMRPDKKSHPLTLKNINQIQKFLKFISITLENGLKQSISLKIYEKIIAGYLYSSLNLTIKQTSLKMNNFVEITQEIRQNAWETSQQTWKLEYDENQKKWSCSCHIKELVGIPCAHLIRYLCKEGRSVRPYISQRWLIKQSEFQEDIRMGKKDSKWAQDIKEQRKWINFGNTQYLQIFWS